MRVSPSTSTTSASVTMFALRQDAHWCRQILALCSSTDTTRSIRSWFSRPCVRSVDVTPYYRFSGCKWILCCLCIVCILYWENVFSIPLSDITCRARYFQPLCKISLYSFWQKPGGRISPCAVRRLYMFIFVYICSQWDLHMGDMQLNIWSLLSGFF